MNKIITTKKVCNKCHTPKPLSEFHKNISSPDGKNKVCKDCVKEANAKHSKKVSDQWAFLF